MGALIDGAYDDRFPQVLQDGMMDDLSQGALAFSGTDALRAITDPGAPRQLGVEQSNLSIASSDKIILKLYRRLRAGPQPDVEVAHFLTEAAGYAHTPRYLGQVAHQDGDQDTTLAAAFATVPLTQAHLQGWARDARVRLTPCWTGWSGQRHSLPRRPCRWPRPCWRRERR